MLWLRWQNLVYLRSDHERTKDLQILLRRFPYRPQEKTRHRLHHCMPLCETTQGLRLGDRFDLSTSGINFVVEFEPMTPVARAGAYFDLAENLTELFDHEIDLVEFPAIRKPDLSRVRRREPGCMAALLSCPKKTQICGEELLNVFSARAPAYGDVTIRDANISRAYYCLM
ncbi:MULTISPECIES: hypothetical protein [unclassified Methanoculleus]|jgi:hypothetical protein|uniref:hypothetical protein n=2 Tax=unclassified Methanoculleus TaxID=2619537 RepID=UPI00319DCACD